MKCWSYAKPNFDLKILANGFFAASNIYFRGDRMWLQGCSINALLFFLKGGKPAVESRCL